MEKRETSAMFMVSVLVVALVSFGAPALCARTIDDQKNYYSTTPIPNPHGDTTPPTHSSQSSPACPTPSNGGAGGHTTPTAPSHGSGGHSTPATPSHGSTGGHSTPTTPETPSHGGGGSHSYPSPSSGGGSSPDAPTITVPSPPEAYDPNVPPFHPGSCSYWISHPGSIVALVGYGTIGDFFGAGCVFAVGGSNPTLHDAVANTSSDGVGALLREGTAALLNSLSCTTFPFTSQQVRSAFATAVGNDGAAAAQADVFKLANEGLYKS